jgi:hypothetical protein
MFERSSIARLLQRKNGFYAFEGALHVRPTTSVMDEPGLAEWNSAGGWRATYGDLADGCFFFAEDVFGGQFCWCNDSVMSFDPETGEKTHVADDIEGWAAKVLAEYDVLTGYPIAHEWQVANGSLPPGHRLVPTIPFVLGGEYELENLFLLETARAMRSRGELAVQLRDLPEGTKVDFKVVD